MEIRTKAVEFYEEWIRGAKEIGETYNISDRTVRRWAQNHLENVPHFNDAPQVQSTDVIVDIPPVAEPTRKNVLQ